MVMYEIPLFLGIPVAMFSLFVVLGSCSNSPIQKGSRFIPRLTGILDTHTHTYVYIYICVWKNRIVVKTNTKGGLVLLKETSH